MTVDQTHPTIEKLSAFSAGQLTEAEAEAVEGHVGDCTTCCDTLMELSSDDTFLDLLREAGNPGTCPTTSPDGETLSASSVSNRKALAEHSRYEIIDLIARGGMGEVFQAKHRMMDRAVALKVINGDLMKKSEAVERFRREVKTAAQLSHANIVTAFDAEEADGVHFLVMEHVDGVNLADLVMSGGRLSVDQAVDYVQQAALGLQHAHEKGMVHRDIKPHNLMLTTGGVVKILDFGLASLASASISNRGSDLPDDPSLTAAGTIMGTPDFIAPEQAIDARAADIRSDIYSLGATFHYLLTGQPPFAEGSIAQRLKSHAESDPASVNTFRSDVPDELLNVISRMMAKDPAKRYQTPQEVVNALASLVDQYLTDQSSIVPTAIDKGPRWPMRVWTAVAMGAFAFLLAGVIYIEVNKGTLMIESLDEGVDVTISKATGENDSDYVKISVVDTDTGSKVVRLPSGEYKVSLGDKASEYELNQGGFTLKRRSKVVIRVSRKETASTEPEIDSVAPMTLARSVQQAFFSQARKLQPEQAKQLEAKLDRDPGDHGSRLQLLGFYSRRALMSKSAREPHVRLILWFVKNCPMSYAAGSHEAHVYPHSDPEGYATVKKLWTEQSKKMPENVAVLQNAASFFLLHERETAADLLKKAQAVEPQNAAVAQQLGQLYKLDITRMEGKERREQAALAMAQFQIAVTHQGDRKNHYWLGDLAMVSVEAGELDLAKRYATQLLEMSDHPKAIHHGNLVLGRVALRNGDFDSAKSHLITAAGVKGGPGLSSSGPNMSLAKELLEKGEDAVVLEFFELCGKFWKKDKLQTWTGMVKRGETPEFGANLAY
jgi:serine/threonine protein kinase